MDFETKRQKVLAYIKGLKTMPVVVTKGPAPEPVATIDGVDYFHKQEFDLTNGYPETINASLYVNALTGEETTSRDFPLIQKNTYQTSALTNSGNLIVGERYGAGGPPIEVNLIFIVGGEVQQDYTSRAFTVVDTQEEVTDNTKICLPTCSAYYGFLSEDGKTFISYYNLKDDGAPTETIMVPVYDQNGVDPTKIEALKAVAAGGKVGEELLDEIVDFIDNPPVPPLPDDKIHAYLTVPADSLTATFDCGTLIEGAEAKVDWGDGTVEDLTANTRMTHTYAAAGDYEVKISGMVTFKYDEDEGTSLFFIEHLREVILSNLIDGITACAFAGCTGLTSITIPDSVTSIGDSAFYDCSSLESISMHNSVTNIDDTAFSGCTGLTSITIPDGVTSIGSNAFSGCTGLTSVTIGSGVTSIGDSAFEGCTSLTSIVVDSKNQAYYSENNCLIRTIDDVLILGCRTSVIPDGVTSIGDGAFSGCTGLTSITIPDGVTSIGSYAFLDCTSLTSITIPDSVTSIDDGAFYDCSSLASITIPDGVTRIGESVLRGCTSLASITIPDSVTSIGSYAFLGCTGLTSATIGSGVTSIGRSAFEDCSSLAEVTFEDGRVSVPTLGNDIVFNGLPADYKIYVQRDLLSAWKAAENWSTIADHIEGLPWTDGHIHGVFNAPSNNITVNFKPGTFIENAEHTIDWGDGTVDNLTADTKISHTYATRGKYDFTIKGTNTIADRAFDSESWLDSISIPDVVTSIGSSAFNRCVNLQTISIGSGVTSIGTYAFYGCSNLVSINIPSNVANIGMTSFYECSVLVEVIFADGRESVPTLADSNAFASNASGRKFYVQADLLDTWKAATNWTTYAADIEALHAA